MTAVIKVENIKKTYQDKGVPVEALRGVTLEIEDGEFTAIAGPSGSGKTTLLNLIGGLDSPTEGKIYIEGEDITRLSPKKLSQIRLKKMGFVFQAYNLIPVLSCYENAEFVLLLQGISKKDRAEKVNKILEEVGLLSMAHRRPRELSGGQQQRVAVARAIVSEPKVILADEPTANLDSKTGKALLELMLGLNQTKGITFLFSTHDSMVMDMARRMVHIHDGQITDIKNKS